MAHNLKHIIEEKLARLDTVPDALVNSSKKVQLEVYKELSRLIGDLEQVGGKFTLTPRNVNLIEQINNQLKRVVFNEEYIDAITAFSNEFNKQAKLTSAYFDTIMEGFTEKEMYASVLRVTQRNALSLLTEDAYTQILFNPVSNILESSVISNLSYRETIQALETFLIGNPEIDGRLVSHVKRVAYDSFAVSDRTYTNIISEDLGLEFYLYQGGTIEDTRDFCSQRNGKYFHKKEIQAWASIKWQGKNSATTKSTIFAFAGGYNCKHSLLPVSLKSVPKKVIQRNIESGNYKPERGDN